MSRHGYETTTHEAKAGTKSYYPHKAEDKAEAILLKTQQSRGRSRSHPFKNPRCGEVEAEAKCIDGFKNP